MGDAPQYEKVRFTYRDRQTDRHREREREKGRERRQTCGQWCSTNFENSPPNCRSTPHRSTPFRSSLHCALPTPYSSYSPLTTSVVLIVVVGERLLFCFANCLAKQLHILQHLKCRACTPTHNTKMCLHTYV